MKIPIYFIIPAMMGFTALFFLKSNWSYDVNEWLLGNALVSMGIGLTYVINGIYIKLSRRKNG